MEMYVYADNDYMAKKRANDLRLSIENRRHSQNVEVKEIGEQPFASTYYRKLDDPFADKYVQWLRLYDLDKDNFIELFDNDAYYREWNGSKFTIK